MLIVGMKSVLDIKHRLIASILSDFKAFPKMSNTYVHIPDSQTYPLESFIVPDHYKKDLASILIPHGMIQDRTEKLAHELSKTLTKPVVACCILKANLF
jgi:hypothetical protein